MARFLVIRLVASVMLLVALSVAILVLSNILIPGDFASVSRLSMTAEQVESLRSEMGLNEPLLIQARDFVVGLARGDLGTSFTGVDIQAVVLAVLPFTLIILLVGVGSATLVGWRFGGLIGWRAARGSDLMLAGVSAVSTLFPPWLAFVLAYFLARAVGFSAFTRLRQFDRAAWREVDLTPSGVAWRIVWLSAATLVALVIVRKLTMGLSPRARRLRGLGSGLVVVSTIAASVLLIDRSLLSDVLGVLALPALGVALVNLADSVLISSTLAEEFRGAPWVLAAKAKGLSESQIYRSHVRRVMLLPLLSRLTASLPLVLGGLVIVEAAFRSNGVDYSIAAPGLSSAIFAALQGGDIPIALGGLLALGGLTIVARLALDIAFLAVDPRLTAADI